MLPRSLASPVVLLLLSGACGNPVDAFRDAARDLPSANDYAEMGKAFQPPKAKAQGDDAQANGDAVPGNPEAPQRRSTPYPRTKDYDEEPGVRDVRTLPQGDPPSARPDERRDPGQTGQTPPTTDPSAPSPAPGAPGLPGTMPPAPAVTSTANADARCAWQRVPDTSAWNGLCQFLRPDAERLPLPAIPDLLNIHLANYEQEAAAKSKRPQFRPADNTLAVAHVDEPFVVGLNVNGMDLTPAWLPADGATHPDQGYCGTTTLFHRGATESYAFHLDTRMLRDFVAADPRGDDGDQTFRFDLDEAIASFFADFTLALRIAGPNAPLFDECQLLGGTRARVVWRGKSGKVTVTLHDGALKSVALRDVVVQSGLGFDDLALGPVPVLGTGDFGGAERFPAEDQP